MHRPSTRWSLWLSVLLGLLLFGVPGHPTHAQAEESDLLLDAVPLYGGTVKYGEWLPVEVTLENTGDAQSGIVRIPVRSGNATNYFGQRVELPSGARKVVTIYATVSNSARILRVEWLPDGAEEPTAEGRAEIDAVPNIRFMAATVAAGGEGLEALNSADLGGEGRPRSMILVPLTLDSLPDRAEPLGTLDLIVLSGVDSSQLSPEQQQALSDFVTRGGLLVLGGGPDAERVLSGLPDPMRPVSLDGERALDSLPALAAWGDTNEVRVPGPFATAVGSATPGATVRLEQEGLPLVVEKPQGSGAIFWMALDPALSPFDAWAGADSFWQTLLGEHSTYPEARPPDLSLREMVQQQMEYSLQNVPALDLPTMRLMVPLLLLYILLVGPINYLVLRQRRRLELAWLTIPLATIVFTVGAYGLGWRLRGSDIIINTVSVALAAPGGDQATVYANSGLFSPGSRIYTLAVPNEAMVSITRADNPWGQPSTSIHDEMTILQGEPTLLEPFSVPQWEMRSIGLEGQWELGGSVTSELALSGNRIVGTVTNNTAHTLVDPTLIMNGRFEHLNTLPPGEQSAVSFDVSQQVDNMGGGLGWEIFGNPDGITGRDAQIRVNLFEVINNSNGMMMNRGAFMGETDAVSPLLRNSTLTLISWPDAIPAQPTLMPAASNAAQVGTTLLAIGLPLSLQAGAIATPPDFISGTVVENEGGGVCFSNQQAPSITSDYRSAEIRWQLPPPLQDIELTMMTIDISYDFDIGDEPSVEVELFDVTQDEWVAVDLSRLGRVENGERYLGPTGVVRMRSTNNRVGMGGCQLFDLRLRGQIGAEGAR